MSSKQIAPLLVLIFVAMPFGQAISQEIASPAKSPQTKLERFMAKTGVALITGRLAMGEVNAASSQVAVEVIEITDAASGLRVSGILIFVTREEGPTFDDLSEIIHSGSISSEAIPKPRIHERTAFVDDEEIDGLLKGLDFVSNANANAKLTKLDVFEISYVTNGQFRAMANGNGKNAADGATLSIGTGAKAIAYLNSQEFDQFKALILKAKQKLDSLK